MSEVEVPLRTWADHGRPQWFYCYGAGAEPDWTYEYGDVVKVTEVGAGVLVFRLRDRSEVDWSADQPFWAIVHCCRGEKDRFGDPYGDHAEGCAEYARQLALPSPVVRKPPPPAPLPRHCDTCTCAADRTEAAP